MVFEDFENVLGLWNWDRGLDTTIRRLDLLDVHRNELCTTYP